MSYSFCFWLRRVFVTARGPSLVAVIGGYSLAGVCRLLTAVASRGAAPGL